MSGEILATVTVDIETHGKVSVPEVQDIIEVLDELAETHEGFIRFRIRSSWRNI